MEFVKEWLLQILIKIVFKKVVKRLVIKLLFVIGRLVRKVLSVHMCELQPHI